MRNVSGITGAAPVWVEVMAWLHRSAPSGAPPAPADVESRPVSFPPGGEAARREWFVRGTAPDVPAPAAGGQPRIAWPVSGTVVALDPDIPRGRQRLVLEATGPVAGLSWMVDGQPLGRGDQPAVWEPVPGRHVVALVDAGRAVVDMVRVEVRGPAPAVAPTRQKLSASAGDRVYSAACETPERCSD
jgi:penicillin-binding protein 1C